MLSRWCVVANIWLDNHEPKALEELLKTGFQVEVDTLNDKGFADLLWHGPNLMEQLERKQARELLGNLDGIRAQIKKEIEFGVADQLYISVEGMVAPTGPGKTTAYHMSKDNKVMYPVQTFNYSYRRFIGWVASMESIGVPVFFVPNLTGLVELVTCLYKRAQGERDDPFSKYVKQRPTIQEWNPYVLTMMGIEGGGLGEEYSRALIHRWGTPYDVFLQPASVLAETMTIPMGEKTKPQRLGSVVVNKLLKAIGREP